MEIDGKFTVEKGSSFSRALYQELHLSKQEGNSIWFKIEEILKEDEKLENLGKVNAGQEFELKESTMKKIINLVNDKFKKSLSLGKRTEQNPDKKPGELGFNEDTKSAFSTASNEPVKVAKKETEKSQPPVESTDKSGNTGKAKVKVDEQAKKQADDLHNKLNPSLHPSNIRSVRNMFNDLKTKPSDLARVVDSYKGNLAKEATDSVYISETNFKAWVLVPLLNRAKELGLSYNGLPNGSSIEECNDYVKKLANDIIEAEERIANTPKAAGQAGMSRSNLGPRINSEY